MSSSDARANFSPCRSITHSRSITPSRSIANHSEEKDCQHNDKNRRKDEKKDFERTDSDSLVTNSNNIITDKVIKDKRLQSLKNRSVDSVNFSTSVENLNRIGYSESRIARKSKSPSPATKHTSFGFSDFEIECLKAHNEYRTKHGVPALKLNKKLCRYAEEWAKVLAARGMMVHRNNSEYGENIFGLWSSNSTGAIDGREPVDNWYCEVDKHIFGREPLTLKTGHFTQVVWKDSKELGVGLASTR